MNIFRLRFPCYFRTDFGEANVCNIRNTKIKGRFYFRDN